MTDRHDDKLMATASQLATEVAPERDLWPGIAEAINTPRRRRWTPMLAQAAAIILLIGASSGVTYIAVKGQPPPITQVAPELLFEQTAFGGRYNLGPGFQDARAELASQLDTELAKLSPESRAEVEENLKLVNQAIFEINQALAEEPDNTLLQAKLLMAYREELSVLRRVSGLTRNVMMRNDI
jgi:BMFP domain-containing protein YqiC